MRVVIAGGAGALGRRLATDFEGAGHDGAAPAPTRSVAAWARTRSMRVLATIFS